MKIILDFVMAIESKMKKPIRPRNDKESFGKKGIWLILAVLLVVLLGAGWWYSSRGDVRIPVAEDSPVKILTGDYQAVFLDNGQVYFGKLERPNGKFYVLRDVYYMRTGSVSLDAVSSISLTKLGSEAHSPGDQMEINIDHILFIEEMKSDSKVLEAIRAHKNQ